MRRARICLTAICLVVLCFNPILLKNAHTVASPQTNSDTQLQETLTWLKEKLPVYAKQHLEVTAPEKCTIALTYKVNRAELTQAKVFIPLADLDLETIRVSRSAGDEWALKLQTLEKKPSIRFMLYQGMPAEGGQKSEETILIVDEEKAKKVAQVLRRAIKLCVKT